MTIQVTETAGSRKLRQPASGDKTAEREFVVYDDAGIVPTMDDMLNATGMPRLNQSHPDNAGIFANGYSFNLHSERKNTWVVTWSYSPHEVADIEDDEPIDDPASDESLATAFNVAIGQTIIDIWKSDPTIPSNPSTPAATTDIGGTEVHEKGVPVSMALPTAEITVSKTFITQNFQGGGFLTEVTKRNSSSWLGFPAGSLLFKGVTISRPEPFRFDLTYNLSYDKWFHLRQVPKRAEDGNPEYVSTETPTLDVYFRQPFPLTTSFGFIPQV